MALSLPCGGRDRVKNKFAQVMCGHGRSKLQTGAKPVAQCLCSVTHPGHLPDNMQPHPYTGAVDLGVGVTLLSWGICPGGGGDHCICAPSWSLDKHTGATAPHRTGRKGRTEDGS